MSLFVSPAIPALDSNADPVSGADWRFTLTGTTTPAEVYSDATLTASLGSEVEADAGGKFPAIHLDPSITYRARLFDAEGALIADYDPIDQPASASALASSTGAAMLGTASGETLARVLATSTRAYTLGIKPFARSWDEALDMAGDLSGMVGYAQSYGVTGGAGKPTFKVWNESDNASVAGSFRWAVEQARAAGGGKVIFVPVGQFQIRLEALLKLTSNLTVDAPGRNVRIGALNDVEMLRIGDTSLGLMTNIIVRRLELLRYPGLTHIDGDNIYERDGISINPQKADGFWIDECTFTEQSDGAIDASSSALDIDNPTDCRGTISRCLFRRSDKTGTYGSAKPTVDPAPAWAPTALAESPKVKLTFYRNHYDGCGERCPRVGSLAFAHKVNNLHDMSAYRRDDGTTSNLYAAWAVTGGSILSEGDYLRLTAPGEAAYVSGGIYPNLAAWSDTTNLGPGAVKINGSVSEDAVLTLIEGNVASVPVPPYALAVEAVPTDAAARNAWANTIRAEAGAAVSPTADFQYVFVADADIGDRYPDGYRVIEVEGGYMVAVRDSVIRAANFSTSDPLFITSRGTNKTIAAGVLDITGLSNSYIGILGEGGAADTLDSITSTEPIPDGLHLYLYGSASQPITVSIAGNIGTATAITLDSTSKVLHLTYNSGNATWGVVDAPRTLPVLASGPYTPTLTAVANCSGLSIERAYYQRNGNIVTESVRIAGTMTTSGSLVQINIGQKFPSVFTISGDVIGTGSTNQATPAVASVSADTATGMATAFFTASASATVFKLIVTYQYEIK